MITDNAFSPSEVATENSFAQINFNAFESAAPSALKEMPSYVSDDSIAPQMRLFDSNQTEPFGITDANGQVIASQSQNGDIYDIARGAQVYSSCQTGNCSDGGDGSDYEPGDGGDCGPGGDGGCDDGGCSGGGGGILRGLLGRFGRVGLLGRLFGGGGMGFGRFLR